MHTDDELLVVLGHALTTGGPSQQRRPSAGELAAFERTLHAQLAPGKARLWARWAVALTAAGSVTLAGSAVAAAVDLPTPFGAVAEMLGLHRGDGGVQAVRRAMDELRRALQAGDLTAARKVTTQLNADLARLHPSDRSRLRDEAARLMMQERAMEHAGGSPVPATSAPDTSPPANAPDAADGFNSPPSPSAGSNTDTPGPTTAPDPATTEPPTTESSTPPRATADSIPAGSNTEPPAPTTDPGPATTEPPTTEPSTPPRATAEPSANRATGAESQGTVTATPTSS